MKMPSFVPYARERSSASVVEVVTVFCLLARYTMSPPNREMAKPWELLRSVVLLANEVL
jgi:hypothetical protein